MLGPEGFVSPDGFTVALVQAGPGGPAPSLRIEGGHLLGAPERRSPTLTSFQIVPEPGAPRVTLHAQVGGSRIDRSFTVGPPPSRLELTLDPPTPTKGRDTQARLLVQVRTPRGELDRSASFPVLKANVGRIVDLRRVEPGRFEARYLLPETRYPEVAVIVGVSAWPDPASPYGSVASLHVPLASAIDLPGRTGPRARMSIEIAGVKYGPIQVGPDGRFALPVVVPPGHRYGTGLSVDRLGNRRITKVDLMLPPTDQIACVMNPARLPPGSQARARVWCSVSDAYGKPLDDARVEVRARRGTLRSRERVQAGLWEWVYQPPAGPSDEPDVITARYPAGGAASRDELRVMLEEGPATQLALVAAEPVVHQGSSVVLELSATNELGRPAAGAQVFVVAGSGQVSPAQVVAPGRFRLRFTPQMGGPLGTVGLSARAVGPLGEQPHALKVWREGDQLDAAVVDIAGRPVPNQPLLLDDRALTSGEEGLAPLGPVPEGTFHLRHRHWPDLKLDLTVLEGGRLLFPATGAPVATAQLGLTVAPPVPVNVRLRVQGQTLQYWAEDAQGNVLLGRSLELELSGGRVVNQREENGVHTALVALDHPATVSVWDESTGVTALARVQP